MKNSSYFRIGWNVCAWMAVLCLMAACLLPYMPIAAAEASDKTEGSQMLVRENFFYFQETNGISGWEVNSTGCTFKASGGVQIQDNSTTDAFQMRREFVRQTDSKMSVEIVYSRSGVMSTAFMLLDGNTPVVKIGTIGSYVGYVTGDGAFVSLWEYSKGCRIKLDLDLAAKTFAIYQNGQLVQEGLPFFADRNTVNGMLFRTSTEEMGNAIVESIRAYTGYAVNDSYISVPEGILPVGYAVSGNGTAKTLKTDGHGHREAMALRLVNTGNDSAVLTRTFDKAAGKTVVSFLLMNKTVGTGAAVSLQNGANEVLGLAVKDGVWSYKDGDTYKAMTYTGNNGKTIAIEYHPDLWYNFRVILDSASGKADIYANYKLVATGVSVPKGGLDALKFTASAGAEGDAWLEDVQVFAYNELAKDYVAAPQVPEKSTDALIGVESWNAGDDGMHVGWENIDSQPAAHTVLGFADESSSEYWDWQIKYLAEHGVDFLMYCWNENHDNQGTEPLVAPQYSVYLDGYMYAQYSEYMNFAIAAFGPHYSYEDYVNYIIPYWCNYYFTDPRYQTLDNRVVMAFGDLPTLISAMGSEDNVKKLFAEVNEACRGLGFDGAYILFVDQTSGTNILESATRVGFDGIYTYNGSSDWRSNTISNQNAYNKLKESGNTWIPTLSVGWSPECWGMAGLKSPINNRMDPESYEKLTQWIREFSDSMPKDSLSSKLVMVDNWNEIAEGHSIQPTLTYGFSRLESIASAFTKLTQAELKALQVVPSEETKARFNVMYSKNWNGRVWDFDFGADVMQLWYAGAGFYEMYADAQGHLQGLVASDSGEDGYIESIEGQHIDAKAIKKLVLSVKNSGDVDAMKVYFTTDSSPEFSEDKCFALALQPGDEQYSIYVVDTAGNKNWKGTVTQLRVLFEVPENGDGGVISINYIRLLKNSDLKATPKAGATIEELRLDYAYELLEPVEYYNAPLYQSLVGTGSFSFALSGKVTGATGCSVKLDAGKAVKLSDGNFTFKNVALGRHTLFVYDEDGNLLASRQIQAKLGDKAGFAGGVLTVTEEGKTSAVTLKVTPINTDVPSEPGADVIPDSGSTTVPDVNDPTESTDSTESTESTEPTNPGESTQSTTMSTGSTASTTKAQDANGSAGGAAPLVFVGISAGVLVIVAVVLAVVLAKRKKAE